MASPPTRMKPETRNRSAEEHRPAVQSAPQGMDRVLWALCSLGVVSYAAICQSHTLVAWVMRKFKRFKGHKILAGRFLERLAQERSDLFVHWQSGMTGVFA